MALEKRWGDVVATDILESGPVVGSIRVKNPIGFRAAMRITLSKTGLMDVFQIKYIDKDVLFIGKPGAENQTLTDVSAFIGGVASATAQDKQAVTEKDQSLDRYERGPINADRVLPVDSRGEYIGDSNPYPTYMPENDWDEIVLDRNVSKNIEKASFYKEGFNFKTFDLEYDIDEDLIHVTKTYKRDE